MAKLPVLKQFLAQDYASAGVWIGKFLYVLNLFMGSVYAALNAGLTFKDNMIAQINTVSISGANPSTSFKWGFASQPVGVVILSLIDASASPALITKANTVAWSSGAGIVNINNITGLDPTRTYTATFLVVGG